MNLIKHLQAAGVPDHYHPAAIAALERARGLTWAKWRVRLFKAGKIAKLLPWYPIAGHDLRAPVTWSVLPAWGAPDA